MRNFLVRNDFAKLTRCRHVTDAFCLWVVPHFLANEAVGAFEVKFGALALFGFTCFLAEPEAVPAWLVLAQAAAFQLELLPERA